MATIAHPFNAIEIRLATEPGIWSVMAYAPQVESFRYERLPDRVFPSASLIKILVMAETFQQADTGDLQLTDRITFPETAIVPFGLLPILRECAYSVWDLLVYMITVSDNTATNLLIDRLGMNRINAFAANLGLTSTRLRRKMMDFQARREHRENETSPRDIMRLFSLIHQGTLVSIAACHDMRVLMEAEQSRDGLRRNFLEEWPVMRKTGGLEGIRHDVCLVQTPSGPLLLGVFSTGWKDAHQAEQATADIGRILLDAFLHR